MDTDKLDEIKNYVNMYLRSRRESSKFTKELVWSRSGLCYMVFKELELMDQEELEEFFCEQ